MRFPQIYQVGFLTILIWGSIELVRAKLGPSVLMTREAGKLSLWWLAPILASIRWSLGSPATCAHCSLKILKRLARFSNTILSCQLSSDEQHDATYQLKLFYKFCELWFILWYEELPYCISSHERNALSPLLVWGPCLRGQQGLLPGSGVRGGLGERESGKEQYCCFVVPGNVLRSVLHRLQMLHGSGAQLSTILGARNDPSWSLQRVRSPRPQVPLITSLLLPRLSFGNLSELNPFCSLSFPSQRLVCGQLESDL